MPHSDRDFDRELKVMTMYTANANLYIKLSSAGLALTVTFSKEILGRQAPLVPDAWLMAMWAGFLLAIGAGAFYHYLAGKYMENLLPEGAGFTLWNWLSDRCGVVYGVMLLGFYSGAVLFVLHAILSRK